MDNIVFKIKEAQSKVIRSKVKFVGDFKKELEKTLNMLVEKIEVEVQKYFKLGYITLGNNNIKIKINDNAQKIFKTINCVFRYDRSDEKYGNVDIELEVNELSKKPHFHFVGKYIITDREKIIKKSTSDIITAINEIY